MKSLGLALGFAVLLVAGRSRADDTGSLEGLLAQEVVTTASKSAEQGSNAPALVRNITAEEIHRYGMTSVGEALTFLGVGVYGTARFGRVQFAARGVTATNDRNDHVLLLLDGHVLNDTLTGGASFGQDLAIPVELIDHIELVLGPGSAVHGSNAMLAVVNIVTKSASTLGGTHLTVEGGAAGTVRATAVNGTSLDLLGKRTGVTTGIGYFGHRGAVDLEPQAVGLDPASGELTRYSGAALGTGTWGGRATRSYRSDAIGAHVRLVRGSLEIMVRTALDRHGDPSAAGDFDDPDNGERTQRTRASVKQTIALGTRGEGSIRVFGDAFRSRHIDEVSRAGGCAFAGITCRYRDAWTGERIGTELQSHWDWLRNGKLTTTVGAIGTYGHIRADNTSVDAATGVVLFPAVEVVDVNGTLDVAGYVQQTWRPFPWLDLNAGGRLDWRTVDTTMHDYELKPQISPRAAIAVRPWEGATLKGLYARAFRAPSIFELDARSPILLPAPYLSPERARSFEAIFEQQLGSHRLSFAAFDTEYRGIISPSVATKEAFLAAKLEDPALGGAYDPTAPLSQYTADADITSHGFDATFDGSFLHGRLHAATSLTGTVARANGKDKVEVAPQIFGNARAAYDPGGALPTVALASTFAGRTTDDLSRDRVFARVATSAPQLELRMTLTGKVPGVRGLSYRAIGSHVFNRTVPFSVGPVIRETATITQPFLAPTRQWNAVLGLSYDL